MCTAIHETYFFYSNLLDLRVQKEIKLSSALDSRVAAITGRGGGKGASKMGKKYYFTYNIIIYSFIYLDVMKIKIIY